MDLEIVFLGLPEIRIATPSVEHTQLYKMFSRHKIVVENRIADLKDWGGLANMECKLKLINPKRYYKYIIKTGQLLLYL